MVVGLSFCAAACGGALEEPFESDGLVLEATDEAKSDEGSIPFRHATRYDYGLPTHKLASETRRLFKSEAAFRSYFGVASPGVDFSREWAVFYTPGAQNLVRGSMAVIRNVRRSGSTLQVTTRHLQPGTCAPSSTRPFVIVAFKRPSPVTTTTRFYKSDYTRSCAATTRTYDGVAFTADEEQKALVLANGASMDELRAGGVASAPMMTLVRGRPWSSLSAVAAASGIGAATMEALRTMARRPASTGVTAATFVRDLKEYLVRWYAAHGADVIGAGGNTLARAQAAVRESLVTEVTNPEDDPDGHDLQKARVFRHPDVAYPGSDIVWFGAYDKTSGTKLAIYEFN
jgi:hypothetical protein